MKKIVSGKLKAIHLIPLIGMYYTELDSTVDKWITVYNILLPITLTLIIVL